MLELRDVSCGYGGGDVVKNISLKVEDGDFLCILGPNGSGKSTLLKAIAHLLRFRGGVLIDGRESAAFTRRELAKKIALLGQNASLYFPYTVYDTVAMGRYAYREGLLGGLSAVCKEVIEKTLAALELNGERERLISELSGGVLQRVFLARALVQDPDIILLDEPANHLDLNYQVKLFDYLASEPFRRKTLIAVLHDLNLARRYARSVLLMSEGRAAAAGSAARVFSGPALAEVYGMDISGFMRDSLERWGGSYGPA